MPDEPRADQGSEPDCDRIIAALRGAFAREVDQRGMLTLAVDRLVAGSSYQSALAYMVVSGGLSREAVAGIPLGPERLEPLPADERKLEERLPTGSGVGGEGTASTIGAAMVAPIRRGPRLLGYLAVGSASPTDLSLERRADLQKVADALAILL